MLFQLLEWPISVTIESNLLTRLLAVARSVTHEVSGFAHVVDDDNRGYFVRGPLLLPKQKNSNIETDIDMSSVADMLAQASEEGQSVETIRFWFHSHGTGMAFFSMKDENTIESLSSKWAVVCALVINHAGDFECRLVKDRVHICWVGMVQPALYPSSEMVAQEKKIVERVSTYVIPKIFDDWKSWKPFDFKKWKKWKDLLPCPKCRKNSVRRYHDYEWCTEGDCTYVQRNSLT